MHLIRLPVLLALLVLAFCASANERYYRYKTDDGATVIKSSIPPEVSAKGGYDVIDENGRVIEQVEEFAPDEERRRLREKERRREEQEKAQREYDISLLKRYSFVSDIESEQKRQVAQLQTRVAILRGNLRGFRADLEKAYEDAAARERQNKAVGNNLEKRISHLEDRIKTTERLLEEQDSEIEAVRKKYQRAIERFKELEQRRRPAHNPSNNNP